MSAFRGLPLPDTCAALSFACLCVVLVDCCITGGGHYLSIGPLTVRMLFGFAAAVLALPVIFRDLRNFLKKPVIWLFLIFVVYMGICAARGLLAGNRRSVLISDIKGFMWLYLVPVAVAVVTSRQRLEKLLSCVIAGAVLQAVLIIGIHTLCSVDSIWQYYLYDPFIKLQLGTISYVSEGLFRIFTNSSPYMVIGCALMLFRQVKEDKLRWRYVIGIAICLNGLLLTFTRSLYGCVFVVVVCALLALVFFFRERIWKSLGFIAVTVCAAFLLVSCQEFIFDTSYFGFAMERTLGVSVSSPGAMLRDVLDAWQDSRKPPVEEMTWEEAELEYIEQAREEEKRYWQEVCLEKTDATDSVRDTTLAELNALLVQAPFFGNGLGASVGNREDGLDEYFYYDMIIRMGIVGLLLYLAPFAYGLYLCLRQRKKLKFLPDIVGICCGMVGFWAVTWFNPWMNAALGIAWYAVYSVIPGLLKHDLSAGADDLIKNNT